jgi:hypothetical protein
VSILLLGTLASFLAGLMTVVGAVPALFGRDISHRHSDAEPLVEILRYIVRETPLRSRSAPTATLADRQAKTVNV